MLTIVLCHIILILLTRNNKIWKNAIRQIGTLSSKHFKYTFLILFVGPCLLFGPVRAVSSRCEQTCHWLMWMILFGELRD